MKIFDKFFKRNNQKNIQNENDINQNHILGKENLVSNEEDYSNILNKISELKEELDKDIAIEYKAKIEEKIGRLYLNVERFEDATIHFENSLKLHPVFSESYKQLLVLYNKLLIEASQNNLDELSQEYMKKIENLKQLGKEITLKKR